MILAGLPFEPYGTPSVLFLAGSARRIGLIYCGEAFGWRIQLAGQFSLRGWTRRDRAAQALALALQGAELELATIHRDKGANQ